jgi:5'-nucleotidase
LNTTPLPFPEQALPRWDDIDTVLLDMDGTLLDLRFDNYFWQELVPERYAQRHAMPLDAARAALLPRFLAKQGTLDWYCIDFWTRELALDVGALKREVSTQVRFLPGAERFLQTLRQQDLRAVLVTNAHRDTLAIKAAATGVTQYFESVVSSHQFGVPKEHPEFWLKLEAELDFDPQRALFVDDSLSVLQAARRHGIGQIFAISKPDSTLAGRDTADFAAVEAVELLLGSL